MRLLGGEAGNKGEGHQGSAKHSTETRHCFLPES